MELLHTILKGDEKILDVGSGKGRIVNTLKQVYPDIHVTAIEIFEENLKYNKSDIKICGDAKDILHLLFKDYDVVLCTDFLEHLWIEDIINVVYHMKMLAPVVVVSIPFNSKQKIRGDNPYEEHLTIFTGPEYMVKLGFKPVVRLKYWGLFIW